MNIVELRIRDDESNDAVWTFECREPSLFQHKFSLALERYKTLRSAFLEENSAHDMWGPFMEIAYGDPLFWTCLEPLGIKQPERPTELWEYHAYRDCEPGIFLPRDEL